MGKIGGLFGRSTLGPITEHLLKCQACVETLERLIDRFLGGQDVGELAEKINRTEAEADLIKNEIRRNMTPSVWSAVERSEVVRLLGKEDDIADGAAAVAQLLKLRRTACPQEAGEILRRWVHLVRDRVGRLVAEAKSAHEAIESPTGRTRVEESREAIDDLGTTPASATELPDAFLASVFRQEKSLDPVSIMILMEVSRGLADVMSAATNAAEGLERLLKIKK